MEYKENIGKYYNMTSQIFEDEHYYICHDGRELRHIRTEEKEMEVIHKRLKCTDALIAAAVNTKRNVCINTTLKKMLTKTKS